MYNFSVKEKAYFATSSLVFAVLLFFTAACSSRPVSLPANQVDITGLYEGYFISAEERLLSRLEIFPMNESGQFLVRISYLVEEDVKPVPGRGSIFGDSVAIVANPNSDHPFYLSGTYDEVTRAIEGVVNFPDEQKSLEFVFIYLSPLPEDQKNSERA